MVTQIDNKDLRRMEAGDPKIKTLSTLDDALEHYMWLSEVLVGAASSGDIREYMAIVKRITCMLYLILLDVQQTNKKNPVKVFGFEGMIDVSKRKK